MHKTLALTVTLALAAPNLAVAQTGSDSSDGLCADVPVVCLAGAAWVTWQLLLMSEPGTSGPSPIPPPRDDSSGGGGRGMDHSGEYDCFWGSLLYGTCVN